MDYFGPVVAIAAIVMGIGVALWSIYWDHQAKRLQYEERRLMIEKGLTPPAMPHDDPRNTPESSLRAGLVLVCLGVGFVITALFPQVGGLSRIAGAAAPIVLLLGVGHLIYYFVVRKRSASST